VAGHAKIRIELSMAELQKPSIQFSKVNAAITDLTEKCNRYMMLTSLGPLLASSRFGKESDHRRES
jgi:hypothetical protein